MKRTQYNVPASGSAPLVIPAQQASRMVEIAEDNGTAAGLQGFILYFAQDGYTTGYSYAPARQPAVLGNKVAHGKGKGPWVGLPKQVDQGGTVLLRAATTLCKVVSLGNATVIDVTEYD